jgi:hypothetical protein
MLAACGSGSKNEGPAEATGVLQVGGAAGVHYSTPSRSGDTDAGGLFKYLPGETVTFSIGAIVLGSVPGAPRVTAFTLAGGTPPTTEIGLRRELDRSTRVVTPFVRAANIHWLLLALDADHDPANGIDVRDGASRLGGATIDLGTPLHEFGAQLRSLAPGLTLNIAPSRPIAHAYQSIGVKVPVHGITDQRITATLVPFVIRAPVTNDFTRYNADGSRQSQGSDYGDDGSSDIEYSWTYDALGRKRNSALHIDPSLAPGASSHDVEYQYDTRGALAAVIDRFDQFSDGTIDYTSRSSSDNDAYGFPLLQTTDQVQEENGVLMRRDLIHSTYDSRHTEVASTTETDSDGDGVIDARTGYSSTGEGEGRDTRYVSETDDDADGVIDSRDTQTTAYGQGTGTNVTTDEMDNDADGVIDAIYVTTMHYDRDGMLRWQASESDYDNDGVVDSRWRIELDYDADRRTVAERQYQDFDGDGINEWVSSRINSFDSTGNLLSTSNTADYSNDGVADYVQTQTHRYGADGELLGGTSDSSPGTLTAPSHSDTVATNAEVADGVLLLAQEYLEPNYAGYAVAAL